MTRTYPDRREFGSAAQMARADVAGFTRWYDRRRLIARPTDSVCEASPSRPESQPVPTEAAKMRDARDTI